MYAVLLAGGRGTRLMPLTLNVPKPLLPLGDFPILEVLMRQLQQQGAKGLGVCLNHQALQVRSFLGDGSRWDLPIDYAIEEAPLGTAGGIRKLKNLPKDFLVINGDTLTNLDYSAFFRRHEREGACVTVFTPWVEHKIDYGVVTFDPSTDQLITYDEKPRFGYYASSGVYALSRRALAYIPPAGPFDMPELIRAALDDGQAVVAHKCDAYWRDIGTIDHYEAATKDFCSDPGRFVAA